jgi:hypothetical protein
MARPARATGCTISIAYIVSGFQFQFPEDVPFNRLRQRFVSPFSLINDKSRDIIIDIKSLVFMRRKMIRIFNCNIFSLLSLF